MRADHDSREINQPRMQPPPANTQLQEVEMENRRLQRIVAELLIKNQQLREQVSLLSAS